jgi:glycosyltransferase involved in cell wall biosynthesis
VLSRQRPLLHQKKKKMSTPAISVVMSVYNGAKFLGQAVDSILNQSYRDFEFLIIDDGSEDRSSEILEGFRQKDSRIRILRQENRGLIESLNRGCELARGLYIARMDADDVAGKKRLELQVAFLMEHPQIGLLGGAVNIIDVEGRILRSTSNPCSDAEIREALPNDCPFWHPTVMMRKDIFEAAGGYRKVVVHAEDYDLWLRISEVCEMANLRDVLVSYRLHSNQVTTQQCRQMVISSLMARSAAVRRREHKTDPLNSAQSIAPSLLVELGISEVDLEVALAARLVYVIRNMYSTGELAAALRIVEEMRASSRWEHVSKRVMADSYLLAAELYWKQGRIGASLSSVAEAVVARPVILGRPMLPLITRLRGGMR